MRPTAIYPAIFLAVSAVALAASAFAAPRGPNLAGTWRYIAQESESVGGDDQPEELTMQVVEDSPVHFRWIVRVRMANGAGGAVGFDGLIDGKPYPIQGRPGSTSAFTWLADGSLKRVDESQGGIVSETCHVIQDAKRMNCEGRQTDVQGRVATFTEVFVRE